MNSVGESGDSWDWNPRDEPVVHNQVVAYDELRERCPVAHSESLGWSLMRHDDVLAAITDEGTFSSRVDRMVKRLTGAVGWVDPQPGKGAVPKSGKASTPKFAHRPNLAHASASTALPVL